MDTKDELLRAKAVVNSDPDEAVRICSKIIDFDPDAQEAQMALFMFAYVLLQSGKPGVAYHLYQRCAQLNPNIADIYTNMGMCLEESNPEKGVECFKKALKINPNNTGALANLGLMYLYLADPKKAIKYSNKAIELDPNLAAARHNRALALLMKRDYQGWQDYADSLGVKGREARDYGKPDWQGQKDCTVLVYGEQGVGDEVMFASCLEDMAKDVNIVLDTDSRLEDLFTRTFPNIKVYGDRFKTASRAADEDFDYQCAIGQLPAFYRHKAEDFPGKAYLKANPLHRKMFKSLFDGMPGKKIGLAWNGGLPNTKQRERSISLECFEGVISPDNTYINLDYVDPENTKYGMQCFPWATAKKQDIDYLAALVSSLDCVVTSCTTVVYIAGALGIPCLVLTPSKPGYRYHVSGSKFDWYSSVKLVRQQTNQAWKETINAAQKANPEFF